MVEVGGIEEERNFIDAKGVGGGGRGSEELDGVMEGVVGSEDVVSVLLDGGGEKGSIGNGEERK